MFRKRGYGSPPAELQFILPDVVILAQYIPAGEEDLEFLILNIRKRRKWMIQADGREEFHIALLVIAGKSILISGKQVCQGIQELAFTCFQFQGSFIGINDKQNIPPGKFCPFFQGYIHPAAFFLKLQRRYPLRQPKSVCREQKPGI